MAFVELRQMVGKAMGLQNEAPFRDQIALRLLEIVDHLPNAAQEQVNMELGDEIGPIQNLQIVDEEQGMEVDPSNMETDLANADQQMEIDRQECKYWFVGFILIFRNLFS
jgi:hypothetical protein